VDDIVNHTIGKALDQFEIPHQLFKRWKDTAEEEVLPSAAER
jgi:4-hydroxy-3-polyprenylbenzoate decarboxylase